MNHKLADISHSALWKDITKLIFMIRLIVAPVRVRPQNLKPVSRTEDVNHGAISQYPVSILRYKNL